MTTFNIHSWLIVLIVSSLGILTIEGRVLNPINKQEQSIHHQPLKNADNLQDSPNDSEKKVTFAPGSAAQNGGFARSEPESVNDFRPTTPGNSPGVGHSSEEKRLGARSEALGRVHAVAQSAAENVDDFKPTGPGHSPGGGHSKDNQIVEPNA
ncbi:hypothetical protein OSB04_007409 [Centaurea solstitialis]|uniref:Uncharacterized protein n=1 Tax=Centaurea solstitialis TaxID=347529 RepID=A0AA38WSK2_9ASTR|nr:hypothetical protein OSB04_007409 [Centaurea solstitialis]